MKGVGQNNTGIPLWLQLAQAKGGPRPVFAWCSFYRMDQISQYHKNYSAQQAKVMKNLREELDKAFGQEQSRLWHGAPVWFVGENPVAGYSVNSRGVCLLFWNGQAFKDPSLHPVGKFYAAELRFLDVSEIKLTKLRGLIRQAKTNVWDSVGYSRQARAKAK